MFFVDRTATRIPRPCRRLDRWLLAGLLIVANRHLFTGGPLDMDLVFFPDRVRDGQWWSLFTHPFVHVSRYHFLLDAGAFWLLYTALSHLPLWRRLACLAGCAAGSLAAVSALAPEVAQIGLCGLSGVAHGLMAVDAAGALAAGPHRTAGAVSLAVVAVKSVVETARGEVLFAFLHMGLCGTPVAACHLGGVIGGLTIHLLLAACRHRGQHSGGHPPERSL